MGFGKFWNVMEMDIANFQDLDSSRKRGFQTDYGKFWSFPLGKF